MYIHSFMIRQDAPADIIAAVNETVGSINREASQYFNHIGIVDVPARSIPDAEGLFNKGVIFNEARFKEIFWATLIVLAGEEVTQWVKLYQDFVLVHSRTPIIYDGKSGFSVFRRPGDDLEILSRDEVSRFPVDLEGELSHHSMRIRQVIFVGASQGVRNASRTYKFINRQNRWFTTSDWEQIAKALGNWADGYLITEKGTVMHIKRNSASWLQPRERLSDAYVGQLQLQGFELFDITSSCIIYPRTEKDSVGYMSPFAESFSMATMTYYIEANRR